MLGGELIVKFIDSNGRKYLKIGSAHIVEKVGDGYVALTARTNLMFQPDPDSEDTLNAVEGYFFL